MKKLNMGYSRYFNIKYGRDGALFRGRYKSILVQQNSHFIHLPFYIHLNPLDLIELSWREGSITNFNKAVQLLNSYRWNSHLDYAGIKNFPSLTSRELILEQFGSSKEYLASLYDWLKEREVGEIEYFTKTFEK